jgi:hypothetical protein
MHNFGLGIPAPIAGAVLLLWAVVVIAMVMRAQATELAVAIVVTGVIQSPLVELSGAVLFQWIDDIPFVGLMLFTVRLASARRVHRGAAGLVGVGTGAIVIALARSTSLSIGITQARQVIVPGGLIIAGWLLRDRLRWATVARAITAVACTSAIWMLAEALLRQPLINPTSSYLAITNAPLTSLRGGLPSSFYADGISTDAWFRPGGPFLNPPIAGIVLGIGFLTARMSPRRWVRVGVKGLCLLALAAAFARAGLLIVLCLTVLLWCWRWFGPVVTSIVSVGAAIVLADIIGQQGGSGSHVVGLATGIAHGFTTPLGHGFGESGYQAALHSGASGPVSESFIGLFLSWFGWAGLMLLGCLIARARRVLMTATRRDQQAAGWFVIGMIGASALSESATALQGVGPGWLLIGLYLASPIPAVAPAVRLDPSTTELRHWQRERARLPAAPGWFDEAGEWQQIRWTPSRGLGRPSGL